MADLKRYSLDQLYAGGFAEHFEPLIGESPGSDDRSWTAATIYWLRTGS